MPAIGPVTELVIKKRLRLRAVELDRPGIVWAATWSPDTGVAAMNDGADPDDYAEAMAIFNDTVAEGERRFKTPQEFFVGLIDYAQYDADLPGTILSKVLPIVLREWAMNDAPKFDEVMDQVRKDLIVNKPSVYQAVEAAGKLTFDPTTTAPEPTP